MTQPSASTALPPAPRPPSLTLGCGGDPDWPDVGIWLQNKNIVNTSLQETQHLDLLRIDYNNSVLILPPFNYLMILPRHSRSSRNCFKLAATLSSTLLKCANFLAAMSMFTIELFLVFCTGGPALWSAHCHRCHWQLLHHLSVWASSWPTNTGLNVIELGGLEYKLNVIYLDCSHCPCQTSVTRKVRIRNYCWKRAILKKI